jgi:hypothetical protein
MSQKFTLVGKENLINQLRGIGAEVETGVEQTLKAVGDETRDELRRAIPDGAGAISNPGEAPHSQTGNLRSKIFSRLDPKLLGHEILLTVGISAKGFYGFILEYGAAKYTKGFKRKHALGEGARNSAKFGQRLLPRPWFWSAVEKFWAKAPDTVEKSINTVLNKYAH